VHDKTRAFGSGGGNGGGNAGREFRKGKTPRAISDSKPLVKGLKDTKCAQRGPRVTFHSRREKGRIDVEKRGDRTKIGVVYERMALVGFQRT